MGSKKTNGKGSGFALGALLGGLFGGLTALLFAPKSGQKLRKEISKGYDTAAKRASELKDSCVKGSCDLYGKAKDLAEDAKNAASKLIKK